MQIPVSEIPYHEAIVSKFSFDFQHNTIEMFFSSEENLLDRDWQLVIKNWKKGRSKLCSEKKYVYNYLDCLEKKFGIPVEILFMEYDGPDMNMSVIMYDGEYVDLRFESPEVEMSYL